MDLSEKFPNTSPQNNEELAGSFIEMNVSQETNQDDTCTTSNDASNEKSNETAPNVEQPPSDKDEHEEPRVTVGAKRSASQVKAEIDRTLQNEPKQDFSNIAVQCKCNCYSEYQLLLKQELDKLRQELNSEIKHSAEVTTKELVLQFEQHTKDILDAKIEAIVRAQVNSVVRKSLTENSSKIDIFQINHHLDEIEMFVDQITKKKTGFFSDKVEEWPEIEQIRISVKSVRKLVAEPENSSKTTPQTPSAYKMLNEARNHPYKSPETRGVVVLGTLPATQHNPLTESHLPSNMEQTNFTVISQHRETSPMTTSMIHTPHRPSAPLTVYYTTDDIGITQFMKRKFPSAILLPLDRKLIASRTLLHPCIMFSFLVYDDRINEITFWILHSEQAMKDTEGNHVLIRTQKKQPNLPPLPQELLINSKCKNQPLVLEAYTLNTYDRSGMGGNKKELVEQESLAQRIADVIAQASLQ